MRTIFYDDMLWSVFPPASCWNYTFQSFPQGNLTSGNLCQTLIHIYTQWLLTSLHISERQTWASWYSKEFIYMAMNSIPIGRSALLHVWSPPLVIFSLSFGAYVCSSVSLCLFLHHCQYGMSLHAINLAYNAQTVALLHIFSIQV